MTLRYSFHPRAAEEFLALSLQDQEDFDHAIQALPEHPFRGGPGLVVEKLHDAQGLWKIKRRRSHRRAYFLVGGDHLRMLGFGRRADLYLRLRDQARLSPAQREPPPRA